MKNKQDKWEKFITSPRWKWKRQNILRRDSYTDQWILQHEGRHVQADMVHHILPKEDFPQYAMADWNLIAVSRRTHNKVLHNMNGDLTRKGKALMLETAEKNGILLKQTVMVIGLPGSGKSTFTREHMGPGALAYDLDAIASAFRLTVPHAEQCKPARKMANALLKAFAARAHDFTSEVWIIRSGSSVEEISQIRPDRLIVCRGRYRTENRVDHSEIDIEEMSAMIDEVTEWALANGIDVEIIAPPHSKADPARAGKGAG